MAEDLSARERALEARVLALENVTEQLLGLLLAADAGPAGGRLFAGSVEAAASLYGPDRPLPLDLPGVSEQDQAAIADAAGRLAHGFWRQVVAQKQAQSTSLTRPSGQRPEYPRV